MPKAWGMTRMSLKMIEASSNPEYRRIGWTVTSVASAGVRQTSKNSCDFRTSLNSVLSEEN